MTEDGRELEHRMSEADGHTGRVAGLIRSLLRAALEAAIAGAFLATLGSALVVGVPRRQPPDIGNQGHNTDGGAAHAD
jgi:hypothetical protein